MLLASIGYTSLGLLSLWWLSPPALFAWLLTILLILDTGAGFPFIWALLVRCCRPFAPTPCYQHLKSKYAFKK